MENRIEDMNINAAKLLSLWTIMYGQTKSGKTTMMLHICHVLRDYIDVAFVITKSDHSNGAYSNPWKQGVPLVQKPFIMTDISEAWFSQFVTRQEERTKLYNKVNDSAILDSIMRKMGLHRQLADIKSIDTGKAKIVAALRSQYEENELADKLLTLDIEFDKLRRESYKEHIKRNIKMVPRLRLTDDESLAIHYIDMNPRALLIFDDCSDLVKILTATERFRDVATRLRHINITLIIAIHAFVFIDQKIRDQAHNVFLLQDRMFNMYYSRQENKPADKESRLFNNYVYANTFVRDKPYQKLWLIPNEMRVGRVTANLIKTPFTMGSQYIQLYANKISKTDKGETINFSAIGGAPQLGKR